MVQLYSLYKKGLIYQVLLFPLSWKIDKSFYTDPTKVRDKVGRFDDVITGYDSIEGYINNFNYDGAMIGRYANRIGGAR